MIRNAIDKSIVAGLLTAVVFTTLALGTVEAWTFLLQEHVIFAGRIREEEKIDHYNLADAFAMPSTSEGFGFVFLEAAACGLPVLGGRNDGSRDALVDGRLGLMVDPEKPDELLDGLEAILQKEKHVPDCIKPFDFPRFQKQVEVLVAATVHG